MRKFSVIMALIACFPGSHLPVAAAISVNTADPAKTIPTIQIIQPNPNDSALRLEARLAPLGKILKELAAKTGAVIHYSVLPESPVTATCAGANIWQLMDCPLAKQVGMVTNKPEPGKPAEFWLLGTSVGSCKAMTVEPAVPIQAASIKQHKPTAAEQAEIDQGNQNQSKVLLEKFKKFKDKGDRAEALNNLVAVGKIDDLNVRNALEEAMQDKDASIRSQAVETLANIDKDNATDYLNKALQDKSPEVRITALGKAGGQVQLLE
jgi:hypothetical protein